jgi:hypothetical protein
MAKTHKGAELQQSGLRCRRRRVRTDFQPLGGSPHQQGIPDGIGRRQLQEPPGLSRKRIKPPRELLLDAPRQRRRAGEPEPAGQFRRRDAADQFQQRQRVAPGFADDLVAHPRVQRAGQHRVQEHARVILTEPLDHELR